jgi:hypothetical protein
MLKTATRTYETLSTQTQVEFLTVLIFHLSEAARGSYVEAGNEPTQALRGLREYNEMIQDVSKQLHGVIDKWQRKPPYPDDVLFQRLETAARRGDVEGDVLWAVSASFRDVGVAWPKS